MCLVVIDEGDVGAVLLYILPDVVLMELRKAILERARVNADSLPALYLPMLPTIAKATSGLILTIGLPHLLISTQRVLKLDDR